MLTNSARLGLLFAHPDLITQLVKVKDSYNVNVISQALGAAALQDRDHHREHRAGKGGPESLLYVGRQKVLRFHSQHGEDNRNRPMDVWPGRGKEPGKIASHGQPRAKLWAQDHDGQGNQQKHADQ